MARLVLIAAVLLISVALLTSADSDGCRGYGNGLCGKGGRGFCRGECVQTGSWGRSDCDCWERNRSFRGRQRTRGWDPRRGWGNGPRG
uniref:Uncharacterized protein n=1 Tax=Plectus sambesii TaxID=2011161 RepID=A0A914V182_9BILA